MTIESLLATITPETVRDPARMTELVRGAEPFFAANPADAIKFFIAVTNISPAVAPAYRVAVPVLRQGGQQALVDQLADMAKKAGLTLVQSDQLAAGADFLNAVADVFPDSCRPYALLFDQINSLTVAYRNGENGVGPAGPTDRRRLLISVSIWGERYVDTFTQYFVASALSPQNLPALAARRELHLDIHTTAPYVDMIRCSPCWQRLSDLVQVNFVEFSPDILNSVEYRQNPTFKYRIFGAFDHLSIERARSMGADVACVPPDVVFSDGAITYYARMVDEGYECVLGSGFRGQAEALLPLLDQRRDPDTQILTLPARELADINNQHMHHTYKGFVLTKGNREMPLDPSILVFPHEYGAYLRCLHIHPLILSADVIRHPIPFDYYSIDMNALPRFFPRAALFERIKVIEDSDDSFLIELSYSYPEAPREEREFSLDHLLARAPGYFPLHFWAFQHRINLHGNTRIEAIGTYERRTDGGLERKTLPVASRIDLGDDEVAAWLETNRPKPPTPVSAAPKADAVGANAPHPSRNIREMKGIDLVVPVWGQRYVDRFLRYCLPSLLAPGNLPALARDYPLTLLLFSTAEDMPRILASPLMKAAAEVMTVRTETIASTAAELAKIYSYDLMNRCHNLGIERAWTENHGFMLGIADAIYADGSLAEVGRHIASGKRAALTQGINVLENRFDELLRKAVAPRADGALCIAPRTLVSLVSQSLHPISRSLSWGSVPFTAHPSIMYWPLDGHGFLTRAWHLYPIFLYPERNATITTTLDGDFMDQVLSGLDDCAFLDDSDRFLIVGVADPGRQDFIPNFPQAATVAGVAAWLETHTSPLNREMIQHKFWWHDGSHRDEWAHVEALSDRLVNDILALYARNIGA